MWGNYENSYKMMKVTKLRPLLLYSCKYDGHILAIMMKALLLDVLRELKMLDTVNSAVMVIEGIPYYCAMICQNNTKSLLQSYDNKDQQLQLADIQSSLRN